MLNEVKHPARNQGQAPCPGQGFVNSAAGGMLRRPQHRLSAGQV